MQPAGTFSELCALICAEIYIIKHDGKYAFREGKEYQRFGKWNDLKSSENVSSNVIEE